MLPNTDIKFLKGVGEKRAEQLMQLGVNNINALLHFYPRSYEDWSSPVPIFGAEQYERCCVKVVVTTSVTRWRAKSGITMFKATACDSSGALQIIIFNNKFSAAKLKMGQECLLFGQVTVNGGQRQMLSPSIETAVTKQKIRPVYRRTGTLTSKYIEGLVSGVLDTGLSDFSDPLPIKIREKYKLLPQKSALTQIHFPSDMTHMMRARERFIFEELLELQVGFKVLRDNNRAHTDVVIKNDCSEEFLSTLDFKLTSAQMRSIADAVSDMTSGVLMNRLLQGDVGSGKTVVAATLCYDMWKNGYQSAIMAPTEILAKQHFDTMHKFFKNTDVKITLLTGKMSAAEKREALLDISSGVSSIIIGTHALISDASKFSRLGLVVTDEQHRFGVRQRGMLAEKGAGAHVLVMSATPIPRTLALAVYGDLDVSVIDELPLGRIPIETYRIDSSIRPRAFNYIKKFLDEGRQAFIVCPLVEEGELEGVISATEYYEKIKNGAFKDYSVGLLHGQMKTSEKDAVMEKFVNGSIQLLVSTVVIEVGVDVPNAVIMLIENAERFGLSQLHQLRGRVGRSNYKSTCILLSDNDGETCKERLKVMCDTNDGFEIAKRDLSLRGPGDFFGARQHGLPELKIADMMENMNVLEAAGKAATEILSDDPKLEKSENSGLLMEIEELFSRVDSFS